MKKILKFGVIIFLLISLLPTSFSHKKQNNLEKIEAATVMPTIPTVRNEVGGNAVSVDNGTSFLTNYTDSEKNIINFTRDITLTQTQVSSVSSYIVNRNLKINGNGFTLNVEGNDLFNFGNTATTTFHLQNIVLNKTSGNTVGFFIRGGGLNTDIILENMSQRSGTLVWSSIGVTNDQANIFFRGTIGQLPHYDEYWRGMKTLVFEENSNFIDQMTYVAHAEVPNFFSPTSSVLAKVYFGTNSNFSITGMNARPLFHHFSEFHLYNGAQAKLERNGGGAGGIIDPLGMNSQSINIDTNALLTVNNLGNGWAIYDQTKLMTITVNPGGSFIASGGYTSTAAVMAFGNSSSTFTADNPKLVDIRDRTNSKFALYTQGPNTFKILNSNIALWDNSHPHDGTPTSPSPFSNVSLIFGPVNLGSETTPNTFSNMPSGFSYRNYSRYYAMSTESKPTISATNMNLPIATSMSIPITSTGINTTISYSEYDTSALSFSGTTLTALKVGTYPLKITVKDFLGFQATTTINVTIVYPPPRLTVDPVTITLPLNAERPNIMTGVAGFDYANNNLRVDTSGSINTAVPGSYKITYSVTAFGLTTTKSRNYLVGNGTFVGDYALYSNPFFSRIGLVPAPITNDYLIESNQVKLYKISTGEEISIINNPDVTLRVIDSNNPLTNAVGTYNLTYEIKYDNQTLNTSTTFTIRAGSLPTIDAPTFTELNVNAPFIEGDVGATDLEDGTLNVSRIGDVNTAIPGIYILTYSTIDSDSNLVTLRRIVVVNDGNFVVGSSRIIYAKDFSLRTGQVNTTNSAIIDNAQVSVFSKTSGIKLPEDIIINKRTYSNILGTYQITYTSSSDSTATTTKNAIVTKGESPVLTGPNFTEIQINNPYDEMLGMNVTDLEDRLLISDIKTDKKIDTSIPGVYQVIYSVTDSDKNTTTHTKVVLVNDGNFIAGTTSIIEAHDFTKRISEVNTTIPAIIEAAKAKQYSRVTGLEIAKPIIDNHGGYTNITSKYNIVFRSNDNQTLTVEANVTRGNIPTLTTPTLTEIAVGSSFDPLEGVSVEDIEDKDLTIHHDDNYSTNNPGVYIITYSVRDFDQNIVTKTQTLVVNNGNFVIGTDYIINANNFSKRVGQVDTSNSAIINSANVITYTLDGQIIDKAITVNKGLYSSFVGVYPITYTITDDQNATITKNATVTNGSAPTISNAPFTTIIIGQNFSLLEGVIATDSEDGNISSTLRTTGSVNPNIPGFYTITYIAVDSDLNTTTLLRTILVNNGDYFVGNTYVIHASNYELRFGQVDSSDNAMKKNANVQVFLKSTGALTTEAITIDKNGYYTNGINTYNPTYKVSSELNTAITKSIAITKGNNPTINGPTFTEIPLNSVFIPSSGITFSDSEDDLTYSNVSVDKTINTQVAGIYKLTYTVTDSDQNQATLTRIVLVNNGDYAAGPSQIIYAKDFTKRISEVDTTNNAIISDSNAKTYSRLTGEEEGVVGVVSIGGYSNIPNRYTVVLRNSTNDIQINILVTVTQGNIPSLNTSPFSTINVGETFNYLQISTANDTEDGVISNNIRIIGTYNNNIPGVYPLQYAITDSDNNTVTNNFVLVINDNNTVIGDNYIIKAKDFITRTGQVNTDDNVIMINSQVQIYSKTTGLVTEAEVLINKSTYNAVVGVYQITFTIANDQKATINTNITVTSGEAPMITGANYKEIALNTPFDKDGDISVKDAEDEEATYNIINDLNTAVAGVYPLIYQAIDTDGNITRIIRVIVVKDPTLTIGTNFILQAKDFTKRISQVDISDSGIMSHADIQVYSKITGLIVNEPITIDKGAYKNTTGTYNLKYSIINEINTNITKQAIVISGNIPTLTGATYSEFSINSSFDPKIGINISDQEDTLTINDVNITNNVNSNVAGIYQVIYTITDRDLNSVSLTRIVVINDGTYVSGTTHIIKASNFTKLVSNVNTNEANIISDANAKTYLKSTGEEDDSVIITNNGGYINSPNVYNITFKGTNNDAEISIIATVSNGNIPTITNPTFTTINVGETFDPLADVSASDVEDTLLNIFQTGFYDVSTAGVYTITYTVTDSDQNTVTTTQTLLVNDNTFVVGENYLIRANDFAKRINTVLTNDETIITDSAVRVYEKLTGKLVATPLTINKGGYTNTLGTYPITFTIANDQNAHITINASVISGFTPTITGADYQEINLNTPFNQNDNVEAHDDEDGIITEKISISGTVDITKAGVYSLVYSVIDNDLNQTNITRVIVVNDQTVVSGTNFIIQANDFTKRVGEVNTDDFNIINAAKALVYSKTDGSIVNEAITINNGGYSNIVNSYRITYRVTNELATTITKNATVVAGNTPLIFGEEFTEIQINSTFDNESSIKFSDFEDTLTFANISIVGNVDTSKAGIYDLVYTLKDSDQNQVIHRRIVVVNDGNFVVSNTHIIKASDFNVNVSSVNMNDDNIIASANAQIYSKTTGAIDDTIIITNKGGYTNKAGQYVITFKGENNDAAISIIATVNARNIPTLTTPAFKEINIGDTFDHLENATAIDIEDFDISDNIRLNGTYSPNIAGVYALTYSITDADLNTVTKPFVLIVNDNTFVSGDNFIIKAEDFSRVVSTVNTNDLAIQIHAKVQVYNKQTGLLVDENVIVNKGSYKNIVGLYPIIFTSKNDPKATITINAVVGSGSAPTISGVDYLELNVNDPFNPLDGVLAEDLEDGELRVNVGNSVNTKIPGVYSLTYSATDIDGNNITVNRAILVKSSDFVSGLNYIIQASDFTKRTGQVELSDNEIMDAANVFVYSKATGLLVAEPITINKGTYNQIPDVYTITYTVDEDQTSISKKATVTTGNSPILTGPTYTSININSSWNNETGINVRDIEDELTFTDVDVSGSVNTNVAGLYKLTYVVIDSDFNITVLVRIVLVNDGTFAEGTTHVIKAENFSKKVSEVDTNPNAIISDAKVKTYSKLTGDEDGVVVIANTNGYTNTPNQYSITFRGLSNNSEITIIAIVTSGNIPILTVPTFTEIALGDPFNPLEDVRVFDVEDRDLTINYNEDFNTNVPGVYQINYSVIDKDNNSVIKTRILVVNNGFIVTGNNYIISANDFSKRVSDVDTSDSAIINDSSLRIYNKNTGQLVSPIYIINDGGYTNTPGIYQITFSITRDNAAITINAIVTNGNPPTINGTTYKEINVNDSFSQLEGVSASDVEDQNLTNKILVNGHVNTQVAGVYSLVYSVRDADLNETNVTRVVLVKDSSFVSGPNFILKADDFEKRISQVDSSNNAIINAANVQVYNKINGSLVNENIIINNGGYTNLVNSYSITISLANEQNTKTTIIGTVNNGTPPILSAPTFTEIAINSTFDPTLGMNATDLEDANIKHLVVTTNEVDTTKAGIYSITYSITDSDGNKITLQRQVVVNDGSFIIGNTHIIKATSFTKIVSLVNTDSTAVISDANVKVFDKISGLEIDVPISVDLGGYTNIPNQYTITFKDASDNIAITITANVISGGAPILNVPAFTEINVGDTFDPMNGVSSSDVEDGTSLQSPRVSGVYNTTIAGIYTIVYTLTDSDSNVVTKTQILLVSDVTYVVGKDYIIKATDFSKRLSEVVIDDNVLKTFANVQVYSKTTGSLVNTNVTVDYGDYKKEIGTYQITFIVNDDTISKKTITATVTLGASPIIDGTNTIKLPLNSSFNPLESIVAQDFEDGNITSNIKVEGRVDTQKVGVYKLLYSIIDSDNNKDEATKIVIITSKDLVIDGDYAIIAYGFDIRADLVNLSDDFIKTKSQVKIYNILTGDEVLNPAIAIDKGNYTNVPGVYDIKLSFNPEIIIQINVVENLKPIITTSFVDLPLGSVFDPYQGLEINDPEDGNITQNVIITNNVNSKVPGVYQVIYQISDSFGNEVRTTRVVVINDGDYVTNGDVIIRASNYQINTNDVSNIFNDIINYGKTIIYSKVTGAVLDVTPIIDDGGYKNVPGTYLVIISYGTTSKKINATVVGDSLITDSLIPDSLIPDSLISDSLIKTGLVFDVNYLVVFNILVSLLLIVLNFKKRSTND